MAGWAGLNWAKNRWRKCHTGTNRPFFAVGKQSVHFGRESQRKNVTGSKYHRNKLSVDKNVGDICAGPNVTVSVCG